MREISTSKFKATCLAVLEEVSKTHEPIRITKFGKPIAEVVPPSPTEQPKASWLGSMRGTATFIGDIVSPVTEESDWEALR